MVYGDRRPYLVALVTLRPDGVATFARAQGILTNDPSLLARHPKVLERVEAIVQAANAELPPYARIKKFAVLPVDFTEEGGELTPTQKVKRQRAAEKYAAELASLY